MEQISEIPFNLFDGGVIILILISAIFAYARGLVHEIFSIVGWIGAILATIYGFTYAQPYARNLIKMDILADLAAGMLIFLFSLVVLSLLTRQITSRIRDSALNSLDRALGFLFGLIRGALVIVVAYIALEFIVPQKSHPLWVQDARTIIFIKPVAAFLITNLPDNYALRRHRNRNGTRNNETNKDANAIVRELIAPDPNAGKKKARDGYGTEERHDMERLILNTQPK